VAWPDGTVTRCYHFTHALYQEVLYERIAAGRLIHFHRRIGEREEKAYGNMGQVAEGLMALQEVLAAAQATGERVYDARLYRLRADPLLALAA
jgi:hypothetical protein